MGKTRISLFTGKKLLKRPLSDLKKVSVVSLNNNVLVFNATSKNTYQYVAFSTIAELLCNMSGENLCHQQNELCLFDECADRSCLAPAIEKSQICVDCIAKLKEKGIVKSQIDDAFLILRWCRRNTGASSLLIRTIMNPLTSLAIGTSIGWASSAFIQSGQYHIIIAIVTIAIAAVALFYLYDDHQKYKART